MSNIQYTINYFSEQFPLIVRRKTSPITFDWSEQDAQLSPILALIIDNFFTIATFKFKPKQSIWIYLNRFCLSKVVISNENGEYQNQYRCLTETEKNPRERKENPQT